MMNQVLAQPILRPEIADAGRIRLGAASRIVPTATPVAVADSGRIRLGAASRRVRTTG